MKCSGISLILGAFLLSHVCQGQGQCQHFWRERSRSSRTSVAIAQSNLWAKARAIGSTKTDLNEELLAEVKWSTKDSGYQRRPCTFSSSISCTSIVGEHYYSGDAGTEAGVIGKTDAPVIAPPTERASWSANTFFRPQLSKERVGRQISQQKQHKEQRRGWCWPNLQTFLSLIHVFYARCALLTSTNCKYRMRVKCQNFMHVCGKDIRVIIPEEGLFRLHHSKINTMTTIYKQAKALKQVNTIKVQQQWQPRWE